MFLHAHTPAVMMPSTISPSPPAAISTTSYKTGHVIGAENTNGAPVSFSRPRTIPEPGSWPNVKRDALEAFKILEAGGVVIVPTDVGYGLMAFSAEGIERAFRAKRREHGHSLGVIGTWQQHRDMHVLPEHKFEMTRVITQEHGAILAVVAPFKKNHPRITALSKQTLDRITKGDTLGIAIGEGPFLRELGRLNDEHGRLMIGSSANLSGTGQKFRVEDIEPSILQCADLVIDYGLQRYHRYGRAGSNIDFDNMKVLRMGAGYELFQYRMKKWFNVDFPPDPEHSLDDIGVGVSLKLDNRF